MMNRASYVDYLRQAAAVTSSLTKSFWLGHFLQSVPRQTLQACHRQLQSKESNTSLANDAVSTSLVVGGRTLLQHVQDALHCLKVRETSLSPNVFELITKSVPASFSNRSGPSDFLCQDYTLNWFKITDFLGEGRKQQFFKPLIECSA